MFEVFGRTGPPTLGEPPLWTLKIPYKLTFILPLIAMLTKEPEMLQPDALYEYTMQQNTTAAGAPPYPVAGFKGAAGRERERQGRGRGGKVDSRLMRCWNRAVD